MDRIRPQVDHREPRVSRSGGSRFLVAVLLLGLVACRSPRALAPSFESDEALARAVLDGLARRDYERLLALSVSKEEFAELVWPTLPASRPDVGMPMHYVWQDSFTKSRGFLAQTIEAFGGQPLTLVRVGFSGRQTEHKTVTIARKSYLVVKDGQGQERQIRVFGSVIRQNGRSKVYSYIID